MVNKLSIDIELNSKQYTEGARQAAKATEDVKKATEDYLKDFGPLRKQLAATKKEAQNLAAQFAMLGDAEKNSEFGKELAENLQIAIEKAAELQDVMADTNNAIKNAASDTAGLDALKEVFDIGKESATAYIGIVGRLTGSEKELKNVVASLAAVQGSFNAVIKTTNALQKNSATMIALQRSGVLSLAQAEKISAAATKASTVAVKGLGIAMKALPYVAVAAGVLAVGKAFVNWASGANKAIQPVDNINKELKGTEKILNDVANAYNGNYASSLGKTLATYKQLQKQYNALTSDHKKTEWIKENANKFKELGLSVNSVNDADKILIRQSADIIEAFKLRAQAAAEAARLQDLYVKRIEAETEARKRANKKQIKSGESVQAGDVDRFGLQEGIDYQQYKHKVGMFYTDAGAMKAQQALAANNIRTYTKEIDDEINASAERLEKAEAAYNDKLDNLGVTAVGSGGSNVTKAQVTELQRLEKVVEDIKKQLASIPKDALNFDELANPLKEKLKAAEKDLKDYRIKIGLDVEDPEEEVKQAKADLDKIEYDWKIAIKHDDKELAADLEKAYKVAKDKLEQVKIKYKIDISEVDIEENELKAKLDKAMEDWKLAVKNNDEAAAEAAREAVIVAQRELNEHNLKYKFEFNPDGMTKAEKDINKIFSDLNKNEKQYDISYLPDNFKEQAEQVINRLNAIKDARQRLQDIIDSNKDKALVDPEAADAIQRAQIALAATDGEYQKLIADAEKFNQVSAGIKERQKDFESFKNTVSSISNVVGTFDSVVSSIESMTNAFEEGKNGWEQFMAVVQTAMSIMNAVITVMEIVNTIQDIMNAKKQIASTSVAAEAAAHAANATAQGTEAGTTTALAAVQTAAVAPAIALGKAMEKLAAANIFAAHSYIPFAGPAIAAGFVAMMEAVLATVGKLDGFAHGGVIGGNSYTGDKLLIRANSGERILTAKQNENLEKIANMNMVPTQQYNTVQVQGIIRGKDILLVQKNYNTIAKRSGQNIHIN